jgi:hypothetical protein
MPRLKVRPAGQVLVYYYSQRWLRDSLIIVMRVLFDSL